jgi:stage V sporulation protein SpoVS
MSCNYGKVKPRNPFNFKELPRGAGSRAYWWPTPPAHIRRNRYHLALWWVSLTGRELAANTALLAFIEAKGAHWTDIYRLRGVLAADRSIFDFWARFLHRALWLGDPALVKPYLHWWSPEVSGELAEIRALLRQTGQALGAGTVREALWAALQVAETRGFHQGQATRAWVEPWLKELGIEVTDEEREALKLDASRDVWPDDGAPAESEPGDPKTDAA